MNRLRCNTFWLGTDLTRTYRLLLRTVIRQVPNAFVRLLNYRRAESVLPSFLTRSVCYVTLCEMIIESLCHASFLIQLVHFPSVGG
jgi:hypothetical protein